MGVGVCTHGHQRLRQCMRVDVHMCGGQRLKQRMGVGVGVRMRGSQRSTLGGLLQLLSLIFEADSLIQP